jgi:hypothetical protein
MPKLGYLIVATALLFAGGVRSAGRPAQAKQLFYSVKACVGHRSWSIQRLLSS